LFLPGDPGVLLLVLHPEQDLLPASATDAHPVLGNRLFTEDDLGLGNLLLLGAIITRESAFAIPALKRFVVHRV